MREFKGTIGIGLANAYREFEFDVDDDATEDEIERAGIDAANNYIEIWWEEVE